MVLAEDVDRERAGVLDARPGGRRVRDAEQDERWIERQRRERVGRDAHGFVVVDRGDDGDAGREVTEHGAEPGVVGNEDGLGGFVGHGRSSGQRFAGRSSWRMPSAAANTSGPSMRRRVVARVAQDGVEPIVAVRRAVVEQRELARARLLGDEDRVLDGAVTPGALDLVLVGGVLRVVDEQVDAVAQVEHVVGDVVVGVVGDGARSVVGEVRDRDALGLDPEPERRVGVPHPPRADLGAVQREVVVGDGLERHVTAQLVGGDREVRRAHDVVEHAVERAGLLVRADRR